MHVEKPAVSSNHRDADFGIPQIHKTLGNKVWAGSGGHGDEGQYLLTRTLDTLEVQTDSGFAQSHLDMRSQQCVILSWGGPHSLEFN